MTWVNLAQWIQEMHSQNSGLHSIIKAELVVADKINHGALKDKKAERRIFVWCCTKGRHCWKLILVEK